MTYLDTKQSTVIERARALRRKLTRRQAWAIGNRARDLWQSRHDGALPEKDLRTKTRRSARGSHMFAVYPPDFWPEIDRMILNAGAADAAQGELWA